MGLDFYVGRTDEHENPDETVPRSEIPYPRWSYGGFSRARSKLAATIGIRLDDMAGFADFDPIMPRSGKSWDGIDDPIAPLLYHSDCDSELTAEECKAIAPRLRELITAWPDEDFDKVNFAGLADAMDEAVKRNLELIFC